MTSDATEPAHGDRMPRWVPRAVVVALLGIGVFLATRWVLFQLSSLLLLLLVSLVLSFALEPAVDRLERLGLSRGVGTLLSFLGTGILTAAFVWVIGRLVATQVADLIRNGPTYLAEAEARINDLVGPGTVDTGNLAEEFQTGGRLGDLASWIAPNIIGIGAWFVTLLFNGLTIALFTFYFVAEGPKLRRTVCSVFPQDRQFEILRVWEVAIGKTGGYIYSRVLLSIVSFLFHWAALWFIGVPSPAALAVWIAVVSQFVPVVGTYLAAVLPLLLAVINDPISALWVAAVILVYQQVENYAVAPRITATTMAIHPAVAFASVLAGGALLGPVGAVLALPLAATGTAIASTYLQRHEVVDSALTVDDVARRRSLRRERPGPRRGRQLPDSTGSTPPTEG